MTVRVSDGAGGSVTQSFSVTVSEVNAPPTLASIPNQTIKTGETLTVSLSAADTDLPAQELVLSMPFGGPLGASVNSATKTFVWTPALNHPAGVEAVTIQVTDSAGASALQSFSINVTPSNLAPVLGVIPPQTVNEGQPLTVTASATDPNTGQPLTFSLEPGAPPGVSLDPASGAITWTPTEAQGPGTFTIGVA